MTKDKYLKTVAAIAGLAVVYGVDNTTVDALVSIATAAAVFFFPK